jgi:hypothetical protein
MQEYQQSYCHTRTATNTHFINQSFRFLFYVIQVNKHPSNIHAYIQTHIQQYVNINITYIYTKSHNPSSYHACIKFNHHKLTHIYTTKYLDQEGARGLRAPLEHYLLQVQISLEHPWPPIKSSIHHVLGGLLQARGGYDFQVH